MKIIKYANWCGNITYFIPINDNFELRELNNDNIFKGTFYIVKNDSLICDHSNSKIWYNYFGEIKISLCPIHYRNGSELVILDLDSGIIRKYLSETHEAEDKITKLRDDFMKEIYKQKIV
jgi:hypothetical protein